MIRVGIMVVGLEWLGLGRGELTEREVVEELIGLWVNGEVGYVVEVVGVVG